METVAIFGWVRQGGEGSSKLQYLDEAKLGEKSRNIRKNNIKMVLAETTDGGGGLSGKGK